MRKIKYSRLLTIIILLCVMVQFGVNIFAKTIDTKVLENEQVEFKIQAKGLVIRDEYIVYSDSVGKAKILVKEGQKIAKSQEVATIYHDTKDIDASKEIEALNKEIDELKSGEKNISSLDIAKLNSEIEEISNDIQEKLLSKNYEDVDMDKASIDKKISERNRLLNNDINSKNLETKEKQKEILSTKLENNTSILTSEISGVVSYKFDGNEDVYNSDNLSQLTKKDINNTDNKYKEINTSKDYFKENEPILRLIDNKYTFVAICADKSQVDSFELNKSVKLNCNGKSVSAKIDNMYEDGNNTIIIFKITDQNIGIYDTRVEEFDIIYKQINGLKIPKISIKSVNNTKGVYVISQENNNSEFVKLEGIIHEDEDYVYIDYYNNKINGIKSIDLYDEIILKPNSISKNIKIK